MLKMPKKIVINTGPLIAIIAGLGNLKVTGSLGVIISAIKIGEDLAIESVIKNMRENGVWISNKLAEEAIRLAKTKY